MSDRLETEVSNLHLAAKDELRPKPSLKPFFQRVSTIIYLGATSTEGKKHDRVSVFFHGLASFLATQSRSHGEFATA